MAKQPNGKGHNKPPREKPKKPEQPSGASGQVRAECYAEYATLVTERTRINWDINALFEKYEAQGIDAAEKKAIKHAYSVAHNGDQSTARDQHHVNVAVMLAVGVLTAADADWSKKAKQIDMFPDATASGEIAYRRAYDEGRRASAVHCLVKSLNPHAHGSRAFEGFNDGWDVGSEDRKNAGLDAPTLTEKKKRGGPVADAVTRDVAEPPAADMDEALARSRAHLGGDLPEPPTPIH